MDYLSTALSLVVMLVALYYFTTRNHNLFKKHRIMHVPLTPLFGNMESFVGRQIMPDLLAKIYLDSKYIGFYEFLTPAIVLRDLDLIKAVTMKNVEQFPDYRPLVKREVDLVIAGILFMTNGDQSPSFTSKIKTMFKLMSDSSSIC
ncbi:hypothetical protein QLX08_009477 [Tetragonisca angustula]|uniref:Uncharacterized protein n=1 Tax=Tetragonisca angustula TaxID=166442 RepID=A0AAW0ZFR5_9HYME